MKKFPFLPFILILFLLVFVNGLNAQIEEPLNVADSLRNEGKVKLAINEYAKLFEKDSTNKELTYNYACALALNWQVGDAFDYLELATKNDSTLTALVDPDFYFLLPNKRWEKLQDRLIKRTEAKNSPYKKPQLVKELLNMRLKDQAFYFQLDIAEKVTGFSSAVAHAIWELKEKLNKENLDRLIEIIDNQGWPKISEVGKTAASAAFLIIQHSRVEVQKKYLPLMREAAENDEASWRSLALLIDRVNLREGKKQVYGSQITRNNDGSFKVYELIAPEYVNQRRKEVGLEPIEEYIKRWNIEWSIPQKSK